MSKLKVSWRACNIVNLWPELHHLRLSRVRVEMMLRRTQIHVNYTPDKSHVTIIIIDTQGQIVQIHLIRKKMYSRCSAHETMVWKVVATIRSAKH